MKEEGKIASHHHQSPSPRQSYLHVKRNMNVGQKRRAAFDRDSDGSIGNARKYLDNWWMDGGGGPGSSGDASFLLPKRTFAR